MIDFKLCYLKIIVWRGGLKINQLSVPICRNVNIFSFCRYSHSKKLISHDVHTNTYNYKYTFMVDVVPVCKVIFLLDPINEGWIRIDGFAAGYRNFITVHSLMIILPVGTFLSYLPSITVTISTLNHLNLSSLVFLF